MAELTDIIPLHSAVSALSNPPVSWGYVAPSWKTARGREFDLEVWADATVNMTSIRLLGASQRTAPAIANDDVEAVSAGADTLQLTTHLYRTGDGPFRITTSGSLAGTGLALATDYWIQVVDANNIRLFTTFEAIIALGSISATGAVDITGIGTGTHTITTTGVGSTTKRLHWADYGLLGRVGDGAIGLTASISYTTQPLHRRRVIAYALEGTPGGTISADVQLSDPR